jgi:hypothetical protein
VGASSRAVWTKFMEVLEEVRIFNPEWAIVHLGHNDVVYHPVRNLTPHHFFEIIPELMGYMNQMDGLLPGCKVIYSTMFPRSEGPYLEAECILTMNYYTVYLFGKSVQEKCSVSGRMYTLNTGLWFSPREGRHHAVYFMPDGVHLNNLGKDEVARGWIRAVRRYAKRFAQ